MPILKRFDVNTFTHEEFVAMNQHENIMASEAEPDDPPKTLETTIRDAKSWNRSEKTQSYSWQFWEGPEIIGGIGVEVHFYDTDRHTISGNISVNPEHRRKGLATQLLAKLLEVAEEHQRTLLFFGTSSTAPAGGMFAQQLGADKGLEIHTHQLVLAEVDKALLESWVNISKSKAKDFEIGFWGNVFPEESLDEICELMNVMNDAPRGDLQFEDFKMTPEDLREWEKHLKDDNEERRVLYVRHKSGELAGFTETFWDEKVPENLWQGNTGVIPKYRGHGLGKWLKAAMLQKVQAEQPTLERVRTGNADSNAAMLAINKALGFKPHIAHIHWQLEIQKLKDYLQKK
jgi:mycothiol synthase